MLLEIKWIGRGGQGVVLANQVFATAAIREGKYSQAFPEFGPERSGAPVRGYTKISDSPIEDHSIIYEPDIIVVIDPRLSLEAESYSGLKEGGTAVINTNEKRIDDIKKIDDLRRRKVFYVDAWKISNEVFKSTKPIFNTPMIGALSKVLGEPRLATLEEVIRDRFKGNIAEQNVMAIKLGFEEVKKL
jgi:pyruvate ferredoxin oxidoreductase gamma subunit